MLIGLSIALCTPDIASGKVSYAHVQKIVASTTITAPEKWDGFIDQCKRVLWSIQDNTTPDACESVFRRLLAEGKVEQPLLTGKQHPGTPPYWVDEQGNGVDI